jgi:hypothetical protein
VSFSPDNVQKKGVSPDGQPRSPCGRGRAAGRANSNKDLVRGPDLRCFCPTGPAHDQRCGGARPPEPPERVTVRPGGRTRSSRRTDTQPHVREGRNGSARAKVGIPTILVEGAQPPLPGSAVTDRCARLASADADAHAAEAPNDLEQAHDWVSLHKVYEIVGKKKAIVDAEWASEAEVSAFTASANQQKASGADARHSRLPGDRPKRVITLAEADAFVAHLLTSWLAAMPDP